MDFLVQVLMLLTLLAVTLASFMSSVGALPAACKFLPELFTVPAVLLVIVEGTRQRFRYVNPKYWAVFVGLAIILLCGAVANREGTGPIVNGLRFYLRAMPFFLLPAVYRFKDWQLRQYFWMLLGVCLIQAPIALYQRHHIMAAAHYNGADAVSGTLMQSGFMSLVLVCALCLLAAGMLRGRISKWAFGALFLVFVIPMSINETKVTAIVLPIGLMMTFILASPPKKRVAAALWGTVVLALGAAIFVPIFDYYQSKSADNYTISSFFFKGSKLSGYMYTHARVGNDVEPSRVDSIVVPLQFLSRDPASLGLGLGLGNVAKSTLGPNFTGAYFAELGNFAAGCSVAAFLLETGLLGLSLILFLHVLVFIDAVVVGRNQNNLIGTVALGMEGVVAVMTLSLLYIGIHLSEALSYMFWFFAGLFVAERERLRMGAIVQRVGATVSSSAYAQGYKRATVRSR